MATTLAAGDIAIIGYDTDDSGSQDTFSFVVLKPITSGTQIFFSNRNWNGSAFPAANGTDNTFTYTAGASLAAGTVVTVTHAQLVAAGINLESSGDTLYAYQGTNADTPTTFLYAVDLADGNTTFNGSLANTGLTAGVNAVAVAQDDAVYAGPTDLWQSALLSSISNSSTWVGANNGGQTAVFQTADSGPFEVADPEQIWIAGANGGNPLIHIDVTSGGAAADETTIFDNTNGNATTSPAFVHPAGVALDTVQGLYFVADSNGTTDRILQGSLSSAANTPGVSPTLTTLWTEPAGSDPGNTHGITDVKVDTIHQRVYFTDNTQLWYVNYNAPNQTATLVADLGTNNDPNSNNFGSPNFANDFALDPVHGVAYVTSTASVSAFGSSTLSNNTIWKVSGLNGGGTTTELTFSPGNPANATDGTSADAHDFPFTNGEILGIDINPATGLLYVSTTPVNGLGAADGLTDGGVFVLNPTNPSAVTWTQLADETSATNPHGLLRYIAVDPSTGKYYVSDDQTDSGTDNSEIYTGSMSTFGTLTAFAPVSNVNALGPEGLTIDHGPTLSVTSAASPTYTETAGSPSPAGTAITLITAATANDIDTVSQTDQLASATVRISSGFLSGAAHQDTLTFTNSGGITGSYNSSTGVLTLTGPATFSAYQTALQSVGFTDSGDNPTDYGADQSRTIAWSVSDGLLSSAEQTTSMTVVGVNDPPVASAPSTYSAQERVALNLHNASLNVSDVDGGITGQNETATLSVNEGTLHAVAGSGTSSGVQISGDNTNTLTITGTIAQINGLLNGDATSTLTFTGNRDADDTPSSTTLSLSIDDNGFNGNGGALTSNTATSTITAADDTVVSFTGLSSNTTGKPVEGQQITATITDGGDTVSSATYTWRLNGTSVQSGSSASYTPAEADEGGTLTLDVSFNDPGNNAITESDTGISVGTTSNIVQESPTENASVSISGLNGSNNAVEGTQLTATVNEADKPASGITYTWTVNGATVHSGVDSAGSTYTPGETDEGLGISVTASFTDTHGFTESGTASGGTVQEKATENAAVSISGLNGSNNAVEGTQLTATVNEADKPASGITYTWTVNGSTVKTGTDSAGNTYTPTETDEGLGISVAVSFTDTHGFAETGTASGGTVQEKATENASVSISGLNGSNNAVEGTQLTATVNEADKPASGITYTWTVNGATVHTGTDAAGSTYTPGESDEGLGISVTASFTDTHGFTESGTASGGTVQEKATENAAVSISGLNGSNNAVEGTQLTATVNEADKPASGITYTWTVNGSTVKTGTDNAGNTYTPTETDEGHAISVAVSFTDTHGFAETGTASGGTVQESAAENAAVSIAGLNGSNNAVEGTQLTASVTEADAPANGITYTWFVNGSPVQTGIDSAGNTYTPTETDEGHAISVAVSFTDTHGLTESGTASGGTVQESATENASFTVSGLVSGHPAQGQQLSATVTEPDAPSSGITYTWQADGTTVHSGVDAAGSTYTPSNADSGKTLSLSISFTDTHGFAETGSGTVGSVDAPPTLSVTSANATFTESANNPASSNNTPVTVLSGSSPSDPDGGNLAGATVTISSGFFTGDVLAFTPTAHISGAYDSGTHTLNLTGSADFAEYQTALNSVTYTSTSDNPTDFDTDTSRTISFTVSDGILSSTPASATVNVAGTDDPPVLSAAPGITNYTEATAPVVVDSGITLSDVDSTTLASATVSITNNFQAGADVLAFTPGAGTGNIAVQGYTNGVLTLASSGASATLAQWQTALDSVTYQNTSQAPSTAPRTIAFQVNDGTLNSATSFTPTFDGGTTYGTLFGSQNPIRITSGDFNADGSLDLGAVQRGGFSDNVLLNNNNGTGTFQPAQQYGAFTSVGIVGIVAGDLNGDGHPDLVIPDNDIEGDVVYFANPDGSFPSRGTQVITGYWSNAASLADVNGDGALDIINSGYLQTNPPDPNTPGQIETDALTTVFGNGHGTFSPAVVTSTTHRLGQIAVADLDGDGVPDVAAQQLGNSFTFDSILVMRGHADGTFSDPITLTPPTFTNAIATGDFNHDGRQDIVTGNSDNTVSVFLNDGAGGFQAPINTTVDALGNGIASVATADVNGDGIADLEVSVSGRNEVGVLVGNGDGTFQAPIFLSTPNPGDVITPDVNNDGRPDLAVANNFDSTSNPNPPSITVFLDTSQITSREVTVTAVNNAPVVGGTTGVNTAYTEQNPAVVVDSGVTVSDVDSTNLFGATVSITGGLQSGDTLHFTNQNGISFVSYSGGVLTLSGSASVANYQAALRSVTFDNQSNDNPTNFGANTSRTVTWQVDDGSASNNLSNAPTSTITITPVNDPPAISGDGNTVDYNEQSPGVTLDSSLTVSDVDNQTLAGATVAIGSGFTAGDELLINGTTSGLIDNGANGSISYSFSGSTLNLSGSDTLADYQAALQSVTFDNPTQDSVNARGLSRTITWQVNDGSASNNLSNQGTTTVNVASVDDPPVITINNATDPTYTEKGSPVFAAPNAGLTDPDNFYMASARISITDFQPGDVLSLDPSLSGPISAPFTAQYDPTTGIFSFPANDALPSSSVDFKVDYLKGVLQAMRYSSTSADPTNGGTHTTRTISWQIWDTSVATGTTPLFQPPAAYSTGAGTGPVALSNLFRDAIDTDVNSDLQTDLLTADATSGQVSVLINHNGDGTFTSPTGPFTAGAGASSIAAADFNEDFDLNNLTLDRMDVVVGHSSGNQISLLLGDGNGGFAAPTNITVGNNPQFVMVGNFNRDFHDDLAVANGGDNTVSLLYGNGDGTFQTHVVLPTGADSAANPVFIASGEFNAPSSDPNPPPEGPDFAIANRGDNSVTIYQGDGQGHFTRRPDVTVGSQPDAIAIGDFNGDFNQYLAVANWGDNTISLEFGNGDGTFTAGPVLHTVGLHPTSIIAQDVNGDGREDLVVTDEGDAGNSIDGDVEIFLANPTIGNPTALPDGTFQSPIVLTLPTGAHPTSVQSADFNLDGNPDLAVTDPATDTVYVLLHTPTTPSAVVQSTVNVSAVNDAPQATAPNTPYSATEQTDLVLQGTGLGVSDVDGNTGTESVTLTVGEGTITIVQGNANISNLNGNGTGTVSFDGTVDDLNALLTGSTSGTITYFDPSDTPSPSTTLTLSINDNGNTGGGNLSATASQMINITAVNDPPVLTGLDAGDTPQYTEGQGGVILDTDQNAAVSDPELNVSPNNYAGASLTLARDGGANPEDSYWAVGPVDLVDTNPSNPNENLSLDDGSGNLTFIGSYTIPGDGTIAFAFNANATADDIDTVMKNIVYLNLSQDPPSSVQIDFTFSDGNGQPGGQDQGTGAAPGTASASVTVAIQGVNNPPVIVPPDNIFVAANTPTPVTGFSFSDVDAEGGTEVAEFQVTSGTLDASPSSGVTILTGSGNTVLVLGTLPDLNAFISDGHLTYTGSTSDDLNVTINDRGHTPPPAQSASVDVPINVDNPPSQPIDSDTAHANQVTEGAAAGTYVGLTAHSTDLDAGDSVTYSLTDSAGGLFQIDATSGAVSVSAAGATGIDYESTAPGHTYAITVQASDGKLTSSQTFAIAVNDAAPNTLPDSYSVHVNGTLNVNAANGVLENDSDPNGGAISAVLGSGPSHAASFGLNSDGSFSYAPVNGFNGTDSFSYRASDGTLQSALTNVTLNVTNTPPIAREDVLTLPASQTTVSGNVLANDSDADGDALSVTRVYDYLTGIVHVVAVPASGSVSLQSNHGVFTIAADGSYTFTANDTRPVLGHFADDPLAYIISDGHGGTAGALLDVHFAAQSRPSTETFNFNFLDASVSFTWYGDGQNYVTGLTGPDGVMHNVTGVGTLIFNDGTINEADGNSLVDDLYYDAMNPDVYAAHLDPEQHYAQYGWHEGRNPNPYFDTNYYLAQNPDVAAAGMDPLTHYDTYGWKEGRNPSANFDTRDYLLAYSDVAATGMDPLAHYLQYGDLEGRLTFPVDAGKNGPIDGFDPSYYLANNPDVAASGMNPFQHYLQYGWHEGRNPSADFNTNFYEAQNPDVAAAGIDPLIHYAESGWHEGRDPAPGFSTNGYLTAYPDVAAAAMSPLQHYLQYGITEGRSLIG